MAYRADAQGSDRADIWVDTLLVGSDGKATLAAATQANTATLQLPNIGSGTSILKALQFARLTADYTLTDNATAQAAFNSTTNGALAVNASTTYITEACLFLTNTGTTSHTWAVLFAGTASITAAGTALFVQAYTATSNALTAVSGIYITGSGVSSATVVTAASTSSTENVVIKICGSININGAGTLIPQIKASAQPNGTEKILAGSYIRMWPVGADTVASVGGWT
jgi:hypothetical protein